eukprot:3530730-Alexandrium_andersonii.AAC.1
MHILRWRLITTGSNPSDTPSRLTPPVCLRCVRGRQPPDAGGLCAGVVVRPTWAAGGSLRRLYLDSRPSV